MRFFKMAGRRPALQWRKLARQNCLRGRATRYVAAAVLWLVAACGCCFAMLLPLSTLLGVLAAVLLPSFLRCVQLRHVRGLLRQEALLLEFVQRVPYCSVGIENRMDIAVPWLCARQRWLSIWNELLGISGLRAMQRQSMPVIFAIILSCVVVVQTCMFVFLLHCLFCLSTPEHLRCYTVWYFFFNIRFVFFLHNQFTAGIPVLLPKGVTDSLEASAGFK